MYKSVVCKKLKKCEQKLQFLVEQLGGEDLTNLFTEESKVEAVYSKKLVSKKSLSFINNILNKYLILIKDEVIAKIIINNEKQKSRLRMLETREKEAGDQMNNLQKMVENMNTQQSSILLSESMESNSPVYTKSPKTPQMQTENFWRLNSPSNFVYFYSIFSYFYIKVQILYQVYHGQAHLCQ